MAENAIAQFIEQWCDKCDRQDSCPALFALYNYENAPPNVAPEQCNQFTEFSQR